MNKMPIHTHVIFRPRNAMYIFVISKTLFLLFLCSSRVEQGIIRTKPDQSVPDFVLLLGLGGDVGAQVAERVGLGGERPAPVLGGERHRRVQ